MFSHVMLGTNDIERAKTFYDALFAALGGKPGRVDPKGRLMYIHKSAVFMLSLPIDGESACHAERRDDRVCCRESGAGRMLGTKPA